MSETALKPATDAGKAPAAQKAEIKAGGPLSAIVPQSIDETYRLAQALAQAGDMVPEAYRGSPQKTMAAILKGMEVGLAPMQALSNIAVVNGRPMLWGDALPALMQRAGHHVDVEIEGEGDSAVAVATLERGDNGRKVIRRFSMKDAKLAGLTSKKGPWQQYPMRMLAMRARAFAIRDGAADALMGLGIADEAAAYGPDRARDITPAAPRRGGVVYADPDPAPAADQEPEVDEVIEAEPMPPEAGNAEDGRPDQADIAAAMEEAREAADSEHAAAQSDLLDQ